MVNLHLKNSSYDGSKKSTPVSMTKLGCDVKTKSM